MTTDGEILRTLDDGALLAWYADERSQPAFAVLVERHAPMVHAACRRGLGRHAHLAEDAAQAVFLLLAEQAARLREQTDVGPWLFRVAGYVTANQRRSEQRRQTREAEVAVEAPTSSRPTDGDWAQAVPHLNDAILALRPKQQQVVVLHFLEGRPASEVARILGCSDGAVRERLTYAIEKLRATLRRRGVAVSATALVAGLASHSASAVEVGVVGACAAAGGPSAALGKPVLAMADGVRRVWFWTQVKAIAAGLTLLVALGGAGVGAVAAAGEVAPATVVLGDFPVVVDLAKPATVTVVIENAAGKRVRNLIAETRLPAGKNRLSWDGFDDGVRDREGNLVRTRAPAGTYRARGLTHDGITTTYEFPLYSGGNPPWHTANHHGGWMADHSSPYGAVAVPGAGGKTELIFSAIVAETGDALIWTDSDGQKVNGSHVFGWDGAVWLARDAGRGRDDVQAYALMGWEGRRLALRALGLKGEGLEIATITTNQPMPRESGMIGLTVAVRDGLAAVSLPLDDAVAFVDCVRKQVLGTVPMTKPKGLAFEADGHLLAVSGTQLKRFTLTRPADGAVPKIDAGTVVVGTGLESPYGVAVDATGSLYVGDWGTSHQVKIFAPTGSAKRTLGKPGGLQLGRYDDQRMHHPCGMAFDERGRLWVAEADWIPKRVSCWDPKDGRLVSAKYGPPHYGGGGTIDPQDKTRAFYAEFGGLMEFKLDWEKGTSTLVAIPIRKTLQGFDPMQNHSYGELVPERPLHLNGKLYFVGEFQGGLRGNDNHAIWLYDEQKKTARPVAFVGSFRHWEALRTSPLAADIQKRGGVYEPMICWTDRNADGKYTADEFAVQAFPQTVTLGNGQRSPLFGFRQFMASPDLSLSGSWCTRVPAPTFLPDGTPVYDISKTTFQVPPSDEMHWAEDGHLGWKAADGSVLVNWTTAYRDGGVCWRYPTEENNGPPQVGGQVIDPTRILGPPVVAAAGEAGEWFALNGERGNMFLFTTDGLFIQTLAGDMRTSPLLRVDRAERGMRVDGMSFEDEHFHPTITQTKEGEIFLVAGKEHSSIFRIGGFPAIKRRDFGSVNASATEIAKLSPTWTIRARKQGRATLAVDVRTDAPVIDGRLDEWANASWAEIGVQAKGAVTIAGERLHAAFRTGDARALSNDAANPTLLFKSGGAVDLMIASDPAAARGRTQPAAGDLRLLVSRPRGKLTAMLYRAVVPGTPEAKRTRFESPIGTVFFDQVVDVTAEMKVAEHDGDIELSVPLAVLGLSPRIDQEILADLGVLRGNGTQTIQRSYWNNLDTAIVSDVPSEARLQPANWGVWKFRRGAAAQPRVAETPKDVVPGLQVAVYEGAWAQLPDVTKLTPVKKALVPEVSLAPATRPERYVLMFTGWIQAPRDGVYTFGITSDDGSRLSLGGQVLADNDGTHGMQEATGAVNLRAGLHAIRIEYLQATNGAGLEVRWETPGGSRELIPASVWRTTP